jgi:hypothetical protein
VEAANKRNKNDLLLEYDILDVFSETDQLSASDKQRMKEIRIELDHILNASGAPGPDGLSFLFYQKFWDVIKSDYGHSAGF